MHDDDGYYKKPGDHMLHARYAIEDDIGPAFNRKAQWITAEVRTKRAARRYAPWIGGAAIVLTASTFLTQGILSNTENEPFVVDAHRAVMASTAETDGFVPLNFEYTDTPQRSAEFEQRIDNCAVRLRVRTAEVMSSPESTVKSTNRYNLVLNESPTAFEFTGYADMVRKLGPSVCTQVVKLSDAAK